MTDGELMKRPNYGDHYVRRRAAELALPEIKSWICAPESSDADLMRDLMRSLTAGGGYESAKALENLGWTVDSQLVGILEDGDFLFNAREELVKQWVKCLRVELSIPVGADVTYRGREGKVIGYESSMAQYRVRTADLKENQWLVCVAEEVTLVASAVAA